MVNTDPIADLLIRIKNAGMAGKQTVQIPFSEMKLRIANVLLAEGYVSQVDKKAKKGKSVEKYLEITLQYDGPRQPRLRGVSRVSKPSRRMYAGVSEIKPVQQGHGIMILSTPKGVMTDSNARKEHVGGEIICKVW